jgi:hypothetical protein
LVAEPTAVAVASLKLVSASGFANSAVAGESTDLNVAIDKVRQFNFTVPCRTVSSCEATDRSIFAARADDDGPLPQWLSFDPYTGTFTGKAPANTVTLKVKISTVGASGAAAWTPLSLNFLSISTASNTRP